MIMKTSLLALSLGIAGILSGPLAAQADFEVSGTIVIQAKTDFDTPLAAIGDWVELGTYGHCWHPRGVAATWRPYCDGTWVSTDSGWYWQSSEGWAWACYHYGTWVYDNSQGWCWIPDTQWAPAWVDWRTSDDYVGWVPCGPAGYTYDPRYYVFVPSKNFCDRVRPTTVIVNNVEIINRTTEIKTINRENREINGRSQTVIINQGPRVDVIEKAAGRTFKSTPIQTADRRTFNSIPTTVRQRTIVTAPSHDLQANPVRQPAPVETRTVAPDHNFTPPPEHANPQPTQFAPENHSPEPDRNPPNNNQPAHNATPPQNGGSSASSHWWSYHPIPKKTAPQPQPTPQHAEPAQHPNNPPNGGGDNQHDHDNGH